MVKEKARMRNLIIKAQCKAFALKNRMLNKENGDSQLVVALVLVAVAIGLCLIFRKQIYDAMTGLFTTITKAIGDLSKGTTVTNP